MRRAGIYFCNRTNTINDFLKVVQNKGYCNISMDEGELYNDFIKYEKDSCNNFIFFSLY